jgi:phosphomannomutase
MPINPTTFSERLALVFKRDDLRGIYPQDFDEDVAALAARAFLQLLDAPTKQVIVVGYDARNSSPALCQAVCNAITASGFAVDNLGMCSSEEIYYACGYHAARYAGGIMITASHNPRDYNGMKFLFSGALPLDSNHMARLRENMIALAATDAPNAPIRGEERKITLKNEYPAFYLDAVGMTNLPKPKAPIKVVVSAGNGVGAIAFKPIAQLLSSLGFEFKYIEDQPDCNFPNGVPNPLLPEFMGRLGKAVVAEKAAIGIGFDGDADRAGFVDEKGQEIIPAHVYVLTAQCMLNEWRASNAAEPMLMRNICCSQLIADYFRDKCTVVDTPVGHGQIKQLMRHPRYKQHIVFAGEHSGHYFYPKFYYVDSGCMTALYMLKNLAHLGGTAQISEQLSAWRQNYTWSGEINYSLKSREAVFACLKELYKTWGSQPGVIMHASHIDGEIGLPLIAQLTEDYQPENMRFPDIKFGVYDAQHGWSFIVRPSGNEPKLRLNAEAWGEDNANRCHELTLAVQKILEG